MRWANKSKDALPPFDEMKWLLTVAWVALHNQLIREVLEAWSLAAFGHVFLNGKVHHCYISRFQKEKKNSTKLKTQLNFYLLPRVFPPCFPLPTPAS
jgi:hypothetical protein